MKKGFTLVELLAVLTLLAFVTIIAVPTMDTILDSSNKKTKNFQIKEILSAAKKYVLKNNESIAFDNDNEYLLSLDKLKKSEFLDNKSYFNPDNKKELNGCIYIKYNSENYKYKYSYIYDCTIKNENSSNSCFTFDKEKGEITGRNIANSDCNIEKFTFPTTIDGIKVRKIKSNIQSYLTNPYVNNNIMISWLEHGDIDKNSGEEIRDTIGVRSSDFTPVLAKQKYQLTRLNTIYRSISIRYYDSNKKFIPYKSKEIFDKVATFTTIENAAYIKIVDESNNYNNKYSLNKIIKESNDSEPIVGSDVMVNGSETGYIDKDTGEFLYYMPITRTIDYIPVQANKNYRLTRLGTVLKNISIRYYDSNKNYIAYSFNDTSTRVVNFTTINNAAYIKIIDEADNLNNTYSLDEIVKESNNINEIDFSKSIYLDEIDSNAFSKDYYNNSSINDIDLSNNSLLDVIGNSSFSGNKIKNVLLPDNLRYIGLGAFKNNSISNITIPEKVETIQGQAFYRNNIKNLIIPGSVLTIGNNSFAYNKLNSVTINNKKNETEFIIYSNPFDNNKNFTKSNIIWKN